MPTRYAPLVVLALALAAATAHGADAWLRVATPNFEVVGNVGEGELKRVALKFELFRNVLDQVLSSSPPAGRPPRVFVFKDRGSYRPYLPIVEGKPVELGGYFQPGHERPYITLAVSPWSEDPYHVVFHEYVHLLTSTARGPSWFREGFAEFLSNCTIGGDKVSLGRPDLSHVWTLRTNRPLPLESLLSIPVPAHDRPRQRLFYAQSWLLVHYLMTERAQGRAQLVAFLNSSRPGQDTAAAFRMAFGSDLSDMEKELERYVEGRTMAYYQVPIVKAALPRDLQARRIAPLEAEALLADLVAQLPERAVEGRQRLSRVLEQEPDLAAAREALAALDRPPVLMQLVHGVSLAVENAVDEEMQALSARVAELLVSETPLAAPAGEVEAAVRSFTERAPHSPDGFMMLAELRRKLGGTPDEVLALLEKAVAADPTSFMARSAVAQAYRQRQDVEAARRVLEAGATLDADPADRALYARELDALKARRSARGWLVDLHCDPSGRLDFVLEANAGQRVTLRAENPLSFTVFRNGQSVQENLQCGKQRRAMAASYDEMSPALPGVDGLLRSLTVLQP